MEERPVRLYFAKRALDVDDEDGFALDIVTKSARTLTDEGHRALTRQFSGLSETISGENHAVSATDEASAVMAAAAPGAR